MILGALLGASSLAAAESKQTSQPRGDADRTLTVEMKNARGEPVGTVTIRQLEHGVVFVADLRNLPPGAHGFHIHERGLCEPPGFESAGGHYNPGDVGHGFDSRRGKHAGDLPNLHVTAQGRAKVEVVSEDLTLAAFDDRQARGASGPFPLHDGDGSAIVIHEKADDYVTQDSAGSRIACGVIDPSTRSNGKR
jgi:Cu-Zn family superoxide dismutase